MIRSLLSVTLFLSFALFAAPAWAQLTPQLRQALQQEIDRLPAQFGVKGVAAAVVLPDSTVWQGAAGLSTDSPAVALRPDMLFAVASVTKTFTAAIIMRLVERGVLALDDSIGHLLPAYACRPGVNPAVTVRQLLGHTSGLAEYTAEPAFSVSIWNTPATFNDHQELVALIENPLAAPDSIYSYNNTEYLLLGLIIEQQTGRSLADVYRRELWEPVGMSHTYLGAYDSIPAAEAEAHAWALRAGQLQDICLEPRTALLSGFNAAGGVLSTVTDIARWGKALFGSPYILAPASQQAMQQLTPLSVAANTPAGLGCTQVRLGNQTGWGHPGNIPGALSIFAYEPACNVSIALVFNDDHLTSLRRAVIARLYYVVQRAICPGIIGNGDEFPVSQSSTLRFAPNPAAGTTQLTFTSNPDTQVLQFVLHDATGQLVQTGPLDPRAQTHDIRLNGLAAGLYHAQVQQVADGTTQYFRAALVVE